MARAFMIAHWPSGTCASTGGGRAWWASPILSRSYRSYPWQRTTYSWISSSRRGGSMNYWLMKTEPSTFGIDHLAKRPRKTAMWDGVRNYQARNMLRDDFRKGDLAFIYHSSTEVMGIAGIMQVVRTAYPDPTAFDK